MRISKGRGGGGGRKNAAPPSVIARLLVWRSLWPSFACVVTLAVAWRTNVLYTETASTRIIASTTASTSSPTTPWQDSLAKPPGNDTTASLPDWIEPYTGQAFQAFRERIDDKIAARRAQMALQQDEPCTFPLFKGEYGFEIGGVIPHVYDTSLYCPVVTRGLPGTHYLYWFAYNHTIKYGVQRRVTYLPKGNPMGPTIHGNNRRFPKSNWTFPNYQQFFFRPEVQGHAAFNTKPLCMIFNKYTPEIHLGGVPKNFIPVDALMQLLDYLTLYYHVVYVRLERKDLLQADDLRAAAFGDKAMIRQRYRSDQVVILDDIANHLDADAVNLLIFSLGAHCRNFVSVQGGNSQVASFFGGQNFVLVKGRVSEVLHGDYTYYWRYANTTVKMVRKQEKLVELVKKICECASQSCHSRIHGQTHKSPDCWK